MIRLACDVVVITAIISDWDFGDIPFYAWMKFIYNNVLPIGNAYLSVYCNHLLHIENEIQPDI